MTVAPLTSALRHGGTPSISISKEKERKVVEGGCYGDRADEVAGDEDLEAEEQHSTEGLPHEFVGLGAAAAARPQPQRNECGEEETDHEHCRGDDLEDLSDHEHR
jgi:hypothetical protein